jgi:hypothetical protein
MPVGSNGELPMGLVLHRFKPCPKVNFQRWSGSVEVIKKKDQENQQRKERPSN